MWLLQTAEASVVHAYPAIHLHLSVQASLQRSAALRGPGLLNLWLAPPSAMMSVGGRARGREVGSIEELSSYNTTETSTA